MYLISLYFKSCECTEGGTVKAAPPSARAHAAVRSPAGVRPRRDALPHLALRCRPQSVRVAGDRLGLARLISARGPALRLSVPLPPWLWQLLVPPTSRERADERAQEYRAREQGEAQRGGKAEAQVADSNTGHSMAAIAIRLRTQRPISPIGWW
jgi:hypothetical protein